MCIKWDTGGLISNKIIAVINPNVTKVQLQVCYKQLAHYGTCQQHELFIS
jgi:hypothetical protein